MTRRCCASQGRPVTEPDALICCAALRRAEPVERSDHRRDVNELAALGFDVTLRNPVGLYMDHLDLTGWTDPDGEPIDPELVRIVAGPGGVIEHAVFEVPSARASRSATSRSAGVPIQVGGQIAEHITVKLVGLASQPEQFSNTPDRL